MHIDMRWVAIALVLSVAAACDSLGGLSEARIVVDAECGVRERTVEVLIEYEVETGSPVDPERRPLLPSDRSFVADVLLDDAFTQNVTSSRRFTVTFTLFGPNDERITAVALSVDRDRLEDRDILRAILSDECVRAGCGAEGFCGPTGCNAGPVRVRDMVFLGGAVPPACIPDTEPTDMSMPEAGPLDAGVDEGMDAGPDGDDGIDMGADAMPDGSPSDIGLVDAGGGEAFLDVAVGTSHSCVLRSDRLVYCWGNNDDGQLGDGTTTRRSTPSLPIRNAFDFVSENYASISSFADFTCGVSVGGLLRCWGRNEFGQIGVAPDATPFRSAAGDVGFLSSVEVVDTGLHHACALGTGTVSCWGRNQLSQLGGTEVGFDDVTYPVPFPMDGVQVQQIAVGANHNLALRSDGSVYCWGSNADFQCGPNGGVDAGGNGTSNFLVTVPFEVGTSVVAIAASTSASFALTADGRVLSWGNTGNGESARSGPADIATPGPAQRADGESTVNLDMVDALWPGHQTNFASVIGGQTLVWGRARGGQAGSAVPRSGDSYAAAVPAAVIGPVGALSSGFADVIIGPSPNDGVHTCALPANGGVACWGANAFGQLGDTTTIDRALPVGVDLSDLPPLR
ncbi:MAG: hypothetical protein AAF645_00345 [Myxococcota bacterium]